MCAKKIYQSNVFIIINLFYIFINIYYNINRSKVKNIRYYKFYNFFEITFKFKFLKLKSHFLWKKNWFLFKHFEKSYYNFQMYLIIVLSVNF